jgi:hypothetical protein
MVKTGNSHFLRFESSVCCLGSADEAHTKKLLVFVFGGENFVYMRTFENNEHSKSMFTL